MQGTHNVWISPDKKQLGKIDTDKDSESNLFYYSSKELKNNFINYGDGESELLFVDFPSVVWDNPFPYKKTDFHTYIVVIDSKGYQKIAGRIDWGFTLKKADYVGKPKIKTGILPIDMNILRTDKSAVKELKIK